MSDRFSNVEKEDLAYDLLLFLNRKKEITTKMKIDKEINKILVDFINKYSKKPSIRPEEDIFQFDYKSHKKKDVKLFGLRLYKKREIKSFIGFQNEIPTHNLKDENMLAHRIINELDKSKLDLIINNFSQKIGLIVLDDSFYIMSELV